MTAVRKVYDGPVDFAVDGMVWNVTKEGVRTRVAMLNSQPYPPPSVAARQQEAPGGEKYETPEWILQGFEWETYCRSWTRSMRSSTRSSGRTSSSR